MILILANESATNTLGVKAANLENTHDWQVHGVANDLGEADMMTRDRIGSFIVVDLSSLQAKGYRSNLGKVEVAGVAPA